MNNKRATKRALLTSVMALVMCVVMLVGTTFAWFTDTASTGVNKIQAGNLKMEVTYKNTVGGGFVKVDKAIPVFNNDALWEPGHVEFAVLNVKNIGTLALKYKLGINIANEVGSTNVDGNAFNLSDYIRFAVLDDDKSSLGRDDLVAAAERVGSKLIKEGYTKESQLRTATDTNEALKNDETVTLVVWMPKSVGNEANYKVAEGITAPSIDLGINVVATQYMHESDSFGNTYDKDATYPVIDLASLKDAIKNGGNVAVDADVKVSDKDSLAARTIISKPTTLQLNKKITSPYEMGNNNYNFTALTVAADTTINAGENGGIDTKGGAYGINVINGANLVINGGTYYGGGTAVQVQKGTVTINGGHFAVEPFSDASYGYNFLLNCIDSAYKDGTAKIIVKGGTFVNFNPANCKAEGAGTNFVADGYKVVPATQTNGDVWYTVVAE
ncbi:MAG: SipW-dependent-type signal peptide-containing protein [Oscillospiraceae bacterium]|jgi:predicted ribosomally synthesized peptide with SipW-like signal peptide